MPTGDEAKAKAADTFNAAADHYDDAANDFWRRFGRRTIDRLELAPGQRVLDVCCGSGASAIPAARAVGPQGFVLGIDLAEGLLALARERARDEGVANAQFQIGDLLAPPAPDRSFDAVVCVFGIFFVPDMVEAARALWRMVAPGGRLAVTTWGPRLFEPASTGFWNAVRDVRPDLHKSFNPWDRISKPEELHALLLEAQIEQPQVAPESGMHDLAGADDWWSVVLGSGYRWTVDQLAAPDRERVREANLDFIRANAIRAVETNVVYAVARKA